MAKVDGFEADEVEDSTPKRTPKRGRARVEHTIKTMFVEEPRIKDVLGPAVLAKPALAEEVAEVEEDDLIEQPASLTEKVNRFLQAVESQETEYELSVWRLPLFHANGRTDTRSGRTYVGKFPFDPDTYESEIKARYARPGLVNIFFCEVRQKGAPVSSLPICHIELEPDGETTSPAPPAIASIANPAPVVGIDSLESQLSQFERFLSLAQKINRITAPAPIAAVASNPVVVPEASEEFALFKLLWNNDSVREKIETSAIGKWLSNTKPNSKPHEPSTVEIVALLIQQAPVLIAEGVKLWHQVRAQAAPAPVAQFAQSPAPLPPNQPVADPMAEYQSLFNALLQGLEQNAPTANAAVLIRAFLIQHPNYDAALMNFLQADTETLLQTIRQLPGAQHLAELPHAAHWLHALHCEFFESEEPNGLTESTGTIGNAA